MSRHHGAHAGDISHTINDINTLPRKEAEELYGIEFRENGKVYDIMYNREFVSLSVWAEFNMEEDEFEYEQEAGKDDYL